MGATEDAIERAYRAAVASLPYCKISVKLLCERAQVSRKVFYKHFGGKTDVLKYVFTRDVVSPQVELCRLLSFEKMSEYACNMEERMFAAVYDDGSFYRNVVAAPQGGREAFASSVSASFRDFNQTLLDEFAFCGSDLEADYVAAYFADAKTQMMLKWVEEDFPLSAGEAGELYSRMALPFWRRITHR